MTKEEIQVDQQLKDLSVNNAPESSPFHIVLVDIRKSAEKRKIECVEIPLSDQDLKYVALSYRWGELEETIVDTQLGYLANITSFDLSHFYVLCQLMIQEPDLESIPYVWVDAICVDQNNHAKRKATIYQMTNIYKRANYILAVPDLHLRHLMNSGSRNDEGIRCVQEYSEYIYHLIHGNADQLYLLEEEWLDEIKVPKDSKLRQSLAKHTDHFVDGLMNLPLHEPDFEAKKETLIGYTKNAIAASSVSENRSEFACISTALHIMSRFVYPSSINQHGVRTTCSHLDGGADSGIASMDDDNTNVEDWLHCVMKHAKEDEWKQKIAQRSECIRQSIYYLADLVKDWANRVWVISEYNIAKNKPKDKFKFWFVQLQQLNREGYLFFDFDFNQSQQQHDDLCIFNNQSHQAKSFHTLTARAEGIYRYFHATVGNQLREQTFLEMILKSKASKNEDRFYSVLAISEYKHLMTSKEVVSGWHITNTLSVKLRLLDFMTPKDKLDLLFLLFQSPSKCLAFPTFATLLQEWPTPEHYHSMALSQDAYNFDWSTSDPILLSQPDAKGFYKLTLKPTEYHSCKASAMLYDEFYIDKKPVFEALGLDHRRKKDLHVVLIARYNESTMKSNLDPGDIRRKRLHLVGSFTKNIWMLSGSTVMDVFVSRYTNWVYHSATEEDPGFNIY